jgi:hypothetical protein
LCLDATRPPLWESGLTSSGGEVLLYAPFFFFLLESSFLIRFHARGPKRQLPAAMEFLRSFQ